MTKPMFDSNKIIAWQSHNGGLNFCEECMHRFKGHMFNELMVPVKITYFGHFEGTLGCFYCRKEIWPKDHLKPLTTTDSDCNNVTKQKGQAMRNETQFEKTYREKFGENTSGVVKTLTRAIKSMNIEFDWNFKGKEYLVSATVEFDRHDGFLVESISIYEDGKIINDTHLFDRASSRAINHVRDELGY